jgi:hypothetical protein
MIAKILVSVAYSYIIRLNVVSLSTVRVIVINFYSRLFAVDWCGGWHGVYFNPQINKVFITLGMAKKAKPKKVIVTHNLSPDEILKRALSTPLPKKKK